MKPIKWLFCFLTYVSWGQTTDNKSTYIDSDQTKYVDIFPNITQTFPSTKFEWKQIPAYRSTIINDREKVNFSIHGKNNKAVYEWRVYRAARDVEEYDSIKQQYRLNIITNEQLNEKVSIDLNNGTRQTNRVTLEHAFRANDFKYKFKKVSTNNTRTNNYWNHLIYDLYIINLYENGIPIDFLYVFVLPKADKNYREGFNSYTEPFDDIGNYRAVGYPEWSGHGLNKVQDLNGNFRYGNFFKRATKTNQSRNGRGMLENSTPALSNLFVFPETEYDQYWSRAARNSINHYPQHTLDTDAYYGISLKIPKNQDWSWIENDSSGQSTVILLEFHTIHFPNRELPVNEGQHLQIAYLGNNKFRLNYGIRDLTKFQKDIYLPTDNEEWVDFIFRFKYKNAEFKDLTHRDFTEEDGLFELWISIGDNDFHKVSYEENTYPFQNINGQKFVPKLSPDKTSVYGPNLINTNPVYFTMTQYRIVNNVPKPIDVNNIIYYDEFITSPDLKKMLNHFRKKIIGTSEFLNY